jgi:uncharacterized glyoxalase superfamily protein PhnB
MTAYKGDDRDEFNHPSRRFKKLSGGWTVMMPSQLTFSAKCAGVLTDKFGTP